MTGLLQPTEVDQAAALDWLRYSLGQGEIISPTALQFIEGHEGHAYALAPETVDPAHLSDFEYGAIGTGPSHARKALASVLATLAERGAACVLVEDELRSRHHPKSSLDGLLLTAFVGEKMIHWASLRDGTEAAILTLHRGSHGYPMNAFVTSASPGEFGLIDGADLDGGIAETVMGSLVAVVVAAYDADSFLLWEPS
jgi:hypothetical protein